MVNRVHYGVIGVPLCGAAVAFQEETILVQDREDVITCPECRQLLAQEAVAHPARVAHQRVSPVGSTGQAAGR